MSRRRSLVGALLQEGPRLVRREIGRWGWGGVVARLPHYLKRSGQIWRARRLAGVAAAPVPPAVPTAPPRLHPELLDTPPPALTATISVVIPTLNAGPEFALLLRKLRAQTGVPPLEILVIDSGSTDGTVAMARAAGARVIEIAPETFSHSGTRNLGAEQAGGEYLLFMVQDAYPIGRLWAHGLLSYLLDHRGEGVVAASCTEFCRADSDLMVEVSVGSYCDFLGCRRADRIGALKGTDHESLRAMGQLSDVSCMIPRELFLGYRYRGKYAEDMDLGVRLIRDGHRIAMLASVKVIHSHNRTAWYYLKRTFVDIRFLVDVFADFQLPRCESAQGLVAGAAQVAREVDAWSRRVHAQGAGGSLHEAAAAWLDVLRDRPVDATLPAQTLDLGDTRLDAWLRALAASAAELPAAAGGAAAVQRSARYVVDDFVARFAHLNHGAALAYPGEDAHLRGEWTGAAAKAFGATLGHALAVLWLDRRDKACSAAERHWLDRVAADLSAGV